MQSFILSLAMIVASQVHAADMYLSDEWTYQTTNAQTALGFTGLALLPFQFFIGYLFFRKVQDRFELVHSSRVDDLLEQKEKSEKTSAAIRMAKENIRAILGQETATTPNAIDKIPEIYEAQDDDIIIIKKGPQLPKGDS